MVVAHGGNRPFKCKICEQTFVFEKFPKKHISQVHDGKKNFKYTICEKEFLSCKLWRFSEQNWQLDYVAIT